MKFKQLKKVQKTREGGVHGGDIKKIVIEQVSQHQLDCIFKHQYYLFSNKSTNSKSAYFKAQLLIICQVVTQEKKYRYS